MRYAVYVKYRRSDSGGNDHSGGGNVRADGGADRASAVSDF